MTSVVPNERIRKILLDARNLMNDGGKHWVKGSYKLIKNGENCYCAAGGIAAATWSSAERNAAFKALVVLGLNTSVPDSVLFPGVYSMEKITTWNDKESTTWKDVDSAFLRAAEKVVE